MVLAHRDMAYGHVARCDHEASAGRDRPSVPHPVDTALHERGDQCPSARPSHRAGATGLAQERQRVSDEAWAEMEAKIEALRRWCGPSIIGISQSEAKRLIADAAAAGVAQALQVVAAAEVALERQRVSDEA